MDAVEKDVVLTLTGFREIPTTKQEVLDAMVPPGWRSLVSELIDDLLKMGWNGYITQVKEKFGGLRFYIGPATHEIFDRIDKSEEDSFHICEKCGEPGELRTNRFWHRTLCDVHNG